MSEEKFLTADSDISPGEKLFIMIDEYVKNPDPNIQYDLLIFTSVLEATYMYSQQYRQELEVAWFLLQLPKKNMSQYMQ